MIKLDLQMFASGSGKGGRGGGKKGGRSTAAKKRNGKGGRSGKDFVTFSNYDDLPF